MAVHVIADVDTGVDDALALLFLVRQPLLKLLAVTCVAGNTDVDQVVRNTLAVLACADASEIPVARGAAAPLIESPRPASDFHGSNGLAGIQLPATASEAVDQHAVELIRRTVATSPEPVTLLALGPLTNVALFIRMYPETAARLERIVIMGGSATVGNATPVAEFNVWHDPEAAAIVFAAPAPVTMYGLDVFYDVAVAEEEYAALVTSSRPAERLAGRLLRHGDVHDAGDERSQRGGLLGDAGVACILADPSLADARRYPARVELDGASRGQTIIDRRTVGGEHELHGGQTIPHTVDVVMAMDRGRTIELFLSTIYEGDRQ